VQWWHEYPVAVAAWDDGAVPMRIYASLTGIDPVHRDRFDVAAGDRGRD